MEGKDMVTPENLRRGILPTSAPRQERTVPVLPRPDVRPAPVSPEPEKHPKTKKSLIQRLSRSLALRVALAGTVLAGTGYAVYENVPAVHRVVDSAFLDHIKGKSSPSETSTKSETFDNSAAKGEISSANILYVPREAFDKTPLADENGNPIFDFPWDNKYPDIKMRYEKSLWPRPDWWKSGPPSPDTRNSFAGRDSLPAGFEFRTPYHGRLFWSGSVYDEEASRKSPSNPYGLAVYNGPIHLGRIEFIAPNGVLYAITISINKFVGGGGSLALEPLIDAPLTGLENDGGKDWEKGILVERGQKIFRTTKEGKLSMNIGGGRNGRLGGPEIEHIPGNFIFQTGKDAAGTQKLLVSDAK